MSLELYSYLQRMHHFIQLQEKRIQGLEKQLRDLSQELKEFKARPPVHVGTIEYKFDQLKVETLEGTLNIGLNPSDLESIEELQVDGKQPEAPLSPKMMMKRSMELEDGIHLYLETDLEPLVHRYEEELNIKVDAPYINFMKDDIRKQIPSRIEYYLKQIPVNKRSPEELQDINEQIEKQIKKDIENAVLAFIKNLADMRKDENP